MFIILLLSIAGIHEQIILKRIFQRNEMHSRRKEWMRPTHWLNYLKDFSNESTPIHWITACGYIRMSWGSVTKTNWKCCEVIPQKVIFSINAILRQVQSPSCVCDSYQFIRFDNENVDDAFAMPSYPNPSHRMNKWSVQNQKTPNTHTFYFRSHSNSNKKESIVVLRMLSIYFYFCVYRNRCSKQATRYNWLQGETLKIARKLIFDGRFFYPMQKSNQNNSLNHFTMLIFYSMNCNLFLFSAVGYFARPIEKRVSSVCRRI